MQLAILFIAALALTACAKTQSSPEEQAVVFLAILGLMALFTAFRLVDAVADYFKARASHLKAMTKRLEGGK